jgi:hypothetical protein
MSEITRGFIVRVGVDLAKRVIQVHAVDAAGRVVAAKALQRDAFMAWCGQLPPGCMIAMEACSGAHHWARKLIPLGFDARLIAAHFVTPYRMQGNGCERRFKHPRRSQSLFRCRLPAWTSVHRDAGNHDRDLSTDIRTQSERAIPRPTRLEY